MAKLGISTGTVPNDGTGDSLLVGAIKVNKNFDEIYNYFGDGANLTSIGGTWITTSVGIHTLKRVGIGTTNPRFALEVGSVGSSGTSLWVNGDARIIGVLTVGASSISLNGSSNRITVGTGITLDGNTGIISASSIVLNGSRITGSGVTSITAGSGITISQSTGNVTITGSGVTSITAGSGITISQSTGNVIITGSGVTSITAGSGITISQSTGNVTINASPGSGVVTSITAGSGITISQSTGNVTINAETYWNKTGSGIHTLSNVGIGTTNPVSTLTVDGSISSSDVTSTAVLNVGLGGTIIKTTYAGLVGISTLIPRFALEVGSVGSSGTSLWVNGDARITGVLSVGQGTISIDGNTNQVTTSNLVVTNSASIKGHVVSVLSFNPVADGVKNVSTGVISGTDNTQAFRNALDYLANLGGGTLYVPTGKYAFYNNAATRLEITSNIRIIGDGPNNTILYFNDTSSSSRRDFLISNSANKIDVVLEDLSIIGDWGANNDFTQRSHLTSFDCGSDSNVSVYRCRFEYSRFFGLVVGYTNYGNTVSCADSYFYRIAGDGFSVRNNKHLIASNNYFKDVNDDSIAFHTREPQSSPVQTSAVITGNKIVDSQGICLLGCKDTTITSNSLTRIHTRAIQIGGPWSSGETGEGKTPNIGILISNNIIDTVFDGNAFSGSTGSGNYYIYIDGIDPNALAGYYVGGPNGSGGILQPYPYFYRNDVSDTPPSTGNWFVNISNNICVRTYQPTTNYSDYGYGSRYARTGISNPQITSTTLGYNLGESSALIHLKTRAFNVLISNNVLDGHARGVRLEGTNSSSFNDWQSVLISNNIISNFSVAGIHVIGSSMVEIISNLVDGDPLYLSSYRGSNGTWTFGGGSDVLLPAILNEGRCLIKNNSFKNVQSVLNTASNTNQLFERNTYYFDPTSDGFNTSNVGIGYYGNSYPFDISPNAVIHDGNPNSSGYGDVTNVCLNSSSTKPSSGKYIKGHFVSNSNPTVLGSSPNRYIVTGWRRVSTGSSHTNITDWVDVLSNIE